MSIWDSINGQPNTLALLRHKAELLAHLIVDASPKVHHLVTELQSEAFVVSEKQYSEAELAALYSALCSSFIVRYVEQEEALSIIQMCNKVISDCFAARLPSGELSEYFMARFESLSEHIQSASHTPSSFLPGFQASYETLCTILHLSKNAGVAVSLQHLIMASIRRWELRELVTGKPN